MKHPGKNVHVLLNAEDDVVFAARSVENGVVFFEFHVISLFNQGSQAYEILVEPL